jgi:hypothetical protein
MASHFEYFITGEEQILFSYFKDPKKKKQLSNLKLEGIDPQQLIAAAKKRDIEITSET